VRVFNGKHVCAHWNRLGASRQWERALDLFLACQMAGAEATKGVCLALLSALEVAAQPRPALQVGVHAFTALHGALSCPELVACIVTGLWACP
jgi:hypothetical protein